MTYGQIRMQVTQRFPGVSLDLIDSWILGRYQEILDKLPWQRLEEQTVIQTVETYAAGTLSATKGSTGLVGAGTAWTTGMTGRVIRIAERAEYYEFTRTGATAGAVDRGYEGETGSGLGYRIDQNVYGLPAGLRVLKGAAPLDGSAPLEIVSLARLNGLARNRPMYGRPAFAALYMDDTSTPPAPQVEFYPIPDTVLGVRLHYDAEAVGSADTAVSLLAWVRPMCLLKGVEAEGLAFQEKFVAAGLAEKRFESLLRDMIVNQCTAKGGVRWKIHPRFSRHWVAAALRGAGRNRTL
jgi:hypothetical protein